MQLLRILFFGLWLSVSTAQTPSLMHYSVQDGLPGNFVYFAMQDRRGLMWFGTDKGLACFDGTRFRTYGLDEGLPDLEVLRMKEDSIGRLWLFCFRKKPCYMYNGRIVTEKQDSLLAQIDFTSGTYNVSEDANGGTWYFENYSKAYYSHNDRIVSYTFPDMEWVSGLEKVGGDYLLLGVHSVMRPTVQGQIERLYRFKDSYGNVSMAVSGNRILYSYPHKLVLVEWANGHIKELADIPKPTGQVFSDRSGRFWVCSTAFGAICYDNSNHDLTNPVTYLPGKKVTAMLEDSQGTLWFCTANEGIFMLPKNTPVTYQEDFFPSKNIRSISINQSGSLFIGDDLGNVHILKNNKTRTISFGSLDGYNLIRQIITDGDDAFWAASDEALYYCQNNYKDILKYSKGAFKSMTLQNENLWYAAASSLGYFLSKKGALERTVFRHRFTTVSTDSEGIVWAGNVGGLYSQQDSFQKNWGDDFPTLKSRIMAIQPAGKKHLWVATPESGLLLVSVDAGKIDAVEIINKRLKSPIQNIQSLFVEPDESVWMATNRGVYGLRKDGHVLHFDRHDGLADDDINSVFVQNDTIWAGTVAGLTRIILQPAAEKGDFATFISRLRYKNDNQLITLHLLDSMPGHQEVKLPPDATSLELNLAGLDYPSRGNLRFEVAQSVMLLPVLYWTFDNIVSWFKSNLFDQKTIEQTESDIYSLGTYLPAGRYQIQVTAIKSSGIHSKYPVNWVLLKLPDWYETIWFYLLIWSGIGYGIWRIYRARLAYREINATASILQLKALQAQMNPHFIGNSINAIQQFLHPPNPVKASEYISIFMRVLRRTMHFSEKTFISFEEEAAYAREYLQLIQLRFGERVQIEITGAENVPANTPIPSMLLQPVLENATIHGLNPDGLSLIRLDFSITDEQFKFVLTDNGMGINETQSQKQVSDETRRSKGLEMLENKIKTLNRLYDLDIALALQDLSEVQPPKKGTQVIITYHIGKIWKAVKKQSPATERME